ncbi:putative serine--tRNA ligase DIA4 [Sporobolomyces salmoneus]|uniref:putative serine--tRNA ligase DIA4 n=1 Tax=Sporobolomyces salmoneus TaxID=183962 RepID=UPI00317807D2
MLLRRISTTCTTCLPRATASTTRFASSSSSTSRPSSLPHPVIDLTDVLDSPQDVKTNLEQRKSPLKPEMIDELRRMEIEAIGLRKELQAARERRNVVSKAPKGDLEARKEGAIVKKLLKELEPRLNSLDKTIQSLALQLPNSSHPHVPIGDESHAKLVTTLGPPISSPPPEAQPHLDHLHLSSPSNFAWTDFPSSSLTTGSSWPLLTNEAALLELALTNYSMSIALSHGFNPVLTPDVVRSEVSERCGFQPRDAGEAQQTYFLSDGESTSNLCLAGTAEIPLVAMSAAKTFRQEDLPLKYVALGRAFRAEAGARGADSRGLYRVHQFSKVEMVVVCAEDESDRLLEELRKVQEEILGGLGLSLRVLDMPTEELGASAHRKYDIEAWMPGRGKWGELSSASNCTDYQSRRLGVRYRPTPRSPTARAPLETLDLPTPAALEATANYPSRFNAPGSTSTKLAYAHTLNGTAAAIPRLIVALLENGAVLDEEAGGGGKVERVRLPRVLRAFWIGDAYSTRIEWV